MVRVHQQAFPGFFLTEMGPAFLTAYYRAVLEDAGGICLVAEREGAPVGFVAGFVDPERFYAGLRGRKWRLAMPVAWGVLRRPRLLSRLLANMARVRGGGEQLSPHPGCAAELASLAVAPSQAGQGLGQRLVQAFLEAAAQRRADYVVLTTDAHNNDRANRFYQRLGFQCYATPTHAEGRVMHAYMYVLSPIRAVEDVAP